MWVNRGSGQEHLTAIFCCLHWCGACGSFCCLKTAFLAASRVLQHRNLFELNTEQAQAIGVAGLASAVLGGNAIRGNQRGEPVPEKTTLGVEVSYDFARFNASGGFSTANHTFGGGFVGTYQRLSADTGMVNKRPMWHLTQTNGWAVKNRLRRLC